MKTNGYFKTVLNTVLCAVLCGVFVLGGTIVPQLMIPSVFLCGMVCVFASGKCGVLGMFISYAAGFAAAFFTQTWVIGNAGEGIAVTLAVYLIGTIPMLVFGCVMKRKMSFDVKYMCAFFSSVALLLVALMIVIRSGFSINGMLDTAADNYKQILTATLEKTGMIPENLMKEVVAEITDTAVWTVKEYLPSIIILPSMIAVYAAVMAGIFVLNRFKVCKIEYTRFNRIHIPRLVCDLTMLLFIFMFFSERENGVVAVLRNVLLVSEFLIGISGISLIDYFVEKKISAGFARFMIYFCVMFAASPIISLIWDLIILLGFADGFINIRMLDELRGV